MPLNVDAAVRGSGRASLRCATLGGRWVGGRGDRLGGPALPPCQLSTVFVCRVSGPADLKAVGCCGRASPGGDFGVAEVTHLAAGTASPALPCPVGSLPTQVSVGVGRAASSQKTPVCRPLPLGARGRLTLPLQWHRSGSAVGPALRCGRAPPDGFQMAKVFCFYLFRFVLFC